MNHDKRLFALALPLLASALLIVPPPALAEGDAPNLAPLPEVDEQLFLVTSLRYAYDAWPKVANDGAAYAAQLDQLRYNAVRYREYVTEKGLDPKIAALYDDLVSTVDAQKQSLIRAKVIRADAQEAQDAAGKKALGGLATTLVSGGTLGVVGIANAVSTLSAGSKATKAADATIAAAQADVDRQLADASARAESVCMVLSDKYKWKHGETGIGTSAGETAEVKAIAAQRDVNALVKWCSDLAARRARDPIVTVMLYGVKAAAAGSDSNARFEAAQACVRAVRLVPAGELYDRDRGRLAYVVAELASAAAMEERGATPASQGAVAKARFACAMYDAAAGWLPPSSAPNEGKLQQGWAAALAMDGKLSEALAHMERVRDSMKDDPGYAYNLACLCSQAGQTDAALLWLRQAMTHGYADVAHARRDPDFDALRQARPAEFDQLTTMTYRWRIIPVILGPEDVEITNTSEFPVTNVTLNAQVVTVRVLTGNGPNRPSGDVERGPCRGPRYRPSERSIRLELG